jgi:hypothetical protein
MSDETERLRARPLCPAFEPMSGLLGALFGAATRGAAPDVFAVDAAEDEVLFRAICLQREHRGERPLPSEAWRAGWAGKKEIPNAMADRAGPSRTEPDRAGTERRRTPLDQSSPDDDDAPPEA